MIINFKFIGIFFLSKKMKIVKFYNQKYIILVIIYMKIKVRIKFSQNKLIYDNHKNT